MYLNATTAILNYSRGTGQVQIRVQDMSKKLGIRAWIYTQPGGSVLASSASFQWIKNETKRLPRPSFGEVFFSIISTAT